MTGGIMAVAGIGKSRSFPGAAGIGILIRGISARWFVRFTIGNFRDQL